MLTTLPGVSLDRDVDAITDIGTIEIQRSQQALWKSGRLAPEWARRFPELFDDDDLRLAEAEGHLGYHFCEWLAAIVLHHTTGYLSLVGKYEFRRHARKQEVVQRLLPPEFPAVLSDPAEHGREDVRIVVELRRRSQLDDHTVTA